jgi:NAD(P)-dependent dehydrogenase (short-subunit alcohol dehydrogenase family)
MNEGQVSAGDSDLAGKVAVVTGAGRGLGQFIAAGLARRGVRVAVVARTAAQVHETVAQIRADGGEASPLEADVSRWDSVERIRDEVHRHLGAVSVLINAAGVFGPIQTVAESDPQRWCETIAINTLGPYLLCRAFLADMLDAGWGRIINFSSAAALHVPGPLNSAYGTSKVALNQFTRHLASELVGTEVTACAIHPGEVRTAMWAAIRDESKTTGELGAGYRRWAEDVGASGGDPPHKALDLVLAIIGRRDTSENGKFLWIADGIQQPIPSW